MHIRIRWLPFNIVPKKLRIVAVDEEGKPGSIRCARRFYYRHLRDIRYLPVTLIFGYLLGIIKYYALFTLKGTSWGSHDAADASIKCQ